MEIDFRKHFTVVLFTDSGNEADVLAEVASLS